MQMRTARPYILVVRGLRLLPGQRGKVRSEYHQRRTGRFHLAAPQLAERLPWAAAASLARLLDDLTRAE